MGAPEQLVVLFFGLSRHVSFPISCNISQRLGSPPVLKRKTEMCKN